MVGAHQILNGSHDLTKLLSGIFVIRMLRLATINMPTKFEFFIFTDCGDTKGGTKCQNGVVWGS